MTLRVESLGKVAVRAIPWWFQGQRRITAIVKLSARIIPDGRMAVGMPEPVHSGDRVRGGAPLGSLRSHDECALHQAQLDVTLDGHAYLPRDAEQVQVRLALGTHERTLINKKLLCRAGKDDSRRIGLTFENAWGGLGHRDNPVGTGFGSMARAAPAITYPGSEQQTACFAPLPTAFPVRRSLLRSLPTAALQATQPALPDDFDWEYFQSAPRDQRSAPPSKADWDALWLLAEHMHPKHAQLRSQLPDVHVGAQLWGASERPQRFQMSPTMLHLDADRLRASIIYRGHLATQTAVELDRLVVLGACSRGGIDWPDSLPQQPTGAKARRGEGLFSTVELSHEQPHRSAPALPFETPQSEVGSNDDGQTDGVELDVTQVPPSMRGEAHPFESTVTLVGQPALTSIPFNAPRRANNHVPEKSSIPGAPWENESVQRRVTPAHAFESTVDIAGNDATKHEPAEARRIQDEEARRARAACDAENRRNEEAKRFRESQQLARKRERTKKKQEADARDEHAAALRKGLYARLGRKKRR